jgi:predicted membrane protein
MKFRPQNSSELSDTGCELIILRQGFRAHQRKLAVIMTLRVFWALIIFLSGPRGFEKTVEKYHGIIVPLWAHVILYFGFIMFGIVLVSSGTDLYKTTEWQKDRIRVKNLENMVLLAGQSGKEELDLLLSTAWSARGGLLRYHQDWLDDIVAPWVLKLEPEEAAALGPDARAWLRERAKNSHIPALRVAAFLTLGELGDRRVRKIAQKARFGADERVQAAAEEVLQTVGGFR